MNSKSLWPVGAPRLVSRLVLMAISTAPMGGIIVEKEEHTRGARDKEEKLNDRKADELLTTPPGESNDRVNGENSDSNPADYLLIQVALLPSLVLAVNYRERDTHCSK